MVTDISTTAETADRFLDITNQVCPMTFVRTKLALETMQPGQVLAVRLGAGEPLDNVPASAFQMGHEILSIRPDGYEEGRDIFCLLIRAGSATKT